MDAHPHTLENWAVRLEPLRPAHAEGLRAASAGDPDIFRYMPASLDGHSFDTWMRWSLSVAETGQEWVWTAIENTTGQIAGSTRYLNVALDHKRVEIGHTWYARKHWGSPVNPAAKLLLFTYGFEVLGLNRIELKTDARNARSRAAIAKLGAKEEGIFRRHMVVQGGVVRDTVYFSVIRDEWPDLKAGLENRLAALHAH